MENIVRLGSLCYKYNDIDGESVYVKGHNVINMIG